MLRTLTFILVLAFANTLYAADNPEQVMENYIAVFDLATNDPAEKNLSFPLSESIRRELVMSGKYKVVDRGNMLEMLGDRCMTGQCIAEAGQLLGVRKIITGSVSKLGNTYYLSLSLVNAQTGKVEEVSEDNCKCEQDDLIDATKRLVKRLLGKKVSETQPTSAYKKKAAARPANKENTPYYSQPSGITDPKEAGEKLSKHPLQVKTSEAQSPPAQETTANTSSWKSSTSTDPTTGIEFILIKGGCYQMGDVFGDGDPDEKPVHEVCIDDYYMAKFDVTVSDFRKFVNETRYSTEAEREGGCNVWNGRQWKQDSGKNWRDPGFSQEESNPVVCVSWSDAKAFTEWIGGKSGKWVRLPREAEWEYAARSGGKQERYAGGNNTDNVAWYKGNSGDRTHPVGAKAPNGLGLFDMSGNVLQWCEDWYDKGYYANSPKNNPAGPDSGQTRVLRGGSWYDDAWNIRAAARCGDLPARVSRLGFRIARTP